MKLRVLDESTNEFTTGHIEDIVDKGVQPVYRVTLADRKVLTLTENHRVLTDEGWRTLREAIGLVGDGEAARQTRPARFMANGVPAYRDPDWLRARRAEGKSVQAIADAAGCSYHTVRKWLQIHDLRFTREERYRSSSTMEQGHPWVPDQPRHSAGTLRPSELRARASRSNFWRGGVTSERASVAAWATSKAATVHAQYDYTCQSCGCAGRRLHAHHIVPVWADAVQGPRHREPDHGLRRVPSSHPPDASGSSSRSLATRRSHRVRSRPAGPGSTRLEADRVIPSRSSRLDYVGLRQTYDLSVEGPWHNFVANGLVVHNSFNEFSLRYAKATDDFYVPELEDVRSQVGKPGAYTFEPVEDELAARTREELRKVYDVAYETYDRLVEAGVARELARSVLPVGAYTEFYWTVNARSLMNFVSLRAAETAQREIRRYALAVEAFLAREMPVTYAAFIGNERSAP